MKIASYAANGEQRFGVVSSNEAGAVDATEKFGSLKRVLEAGSLDELKTWSNGREADINFADVTMLSPVPDATKVVCIGVNFPKIHPVHGKIPPPENISMFSKMQGSLVGHNVPMQRTSLSDSYDYEGEITLVVGKRATNVGANNAASVIAGVTILNDGSVREWQAHSVGAGKNFRAASGIGPWMATLDELPELDKLHMKTWLNGDLVQDMHANEMIFSIDQIFDYLTQFMTLEAGDIVSTGSPERTPVPGRPSPYLQVGDHVDIEIEGVGKLSNSIIAAPTST